MPPAFDGGLALEPSVPYYTEISGVPTRYYSATQPHPLLVAMSSPSSRLRKVKRSPLPELARAPFRKQPEEMAARRVATRASDTELLGSMAARLTVAESELMATRAQIAEKDIKIRDLEKRLSLMTSPPSPSELERKCRALQSQVEEMEEFLNDYGMMWIGGSTNREVKGRDKEVWLPDSSVPQRIDFNLLVRNIQALNVMAGEGCTSISTTPQGAVLKGVQAVPLTLYANGIVMFRGPFRPFSDPHTQQCIQDLLDGYFPSELQAQYPDGVPFELNDQREVTFVPQRRGHGFPGCGQKLGGKRGPSKLYPGPPTSPRTTSELPGHSLSEEQFLCRLPAAVVRGGRLVNIRSEISATLHGSSSPLPDRLTSSTLQISPQTPLQNRLTRLEASFSPISRGSISPEIKMPLTDRLTSSTLRGTISPQLSLPDRPTTNPVSAPSSTTLKIRSESGDDMYIILRMRSHDTIADIWSRLIKKTPPTASATTHQLVMAVTRQVYSDLSASLLDCGLTHNATLHITKTTNSHHSNHVTVTDSNAVRKYHN